MHHIIEPSANHPQPIFPQLNQAILPDGWLEKEIKSTRAEIAEWPASWKLQISEPIGHYRERLDNWNHIQSRKYLDEEACAHDQCQSCHGTGRKHDGSACVHMLSCRCRRCNPASM